MTDTDPKLRGLPTYDNLPGRRQTKPAARVVDKNNDGELEVQIHKDARVTAVVHDPAPATAASTSKKRKVGSATSAVAASAPTDPAESSLSSRTRPCPRIPQLPDSSDDDGDDLRIIEHPSQPPPPPKRPRVEPATRPRAASIHSESGASEPEVPKAAKPAIVDRNLDIKEFFGEPKPHPEDADKTVRVCKVCKGPKAKEIVNEATTLRRHIEAFHLVLHDDWIKTNNYTTKLPKALKTKKDKAAADARAAQTRIEVHMVEKAGPKPEKPRPYSDELFKEAAIEWLVSTNQPIQAFEHPSFKKMIDIAARATSGVKLLDRKATRALIIRLFKQRLDELRARVTSDKVGLISMTCDAWQASNADAYFAATGHWVEEVAPGQWEIHCALIGFTRMNTSHSGRRLARVLYELSKRMGIVPKVSWVTCDNASNNITMLKRFEVLVNRSSYRQGLPEWQFENFHIRCLAHVINLATQQLITESSSTKFFDPAKPTEHEPVLSAMVRDVIGLVRAITVKVRSSAKRKQMFLDLQQKLRVLEEAVNMILDMPVRWSSTYMMLKRAYDLRKVVDQFIYDLGLEESDWTKRAKIHDLKLTTEEWARVKLMIDLLEPADSTQQAFSHESDCSLFDAIPVLESLHTVWSTCAKRAKYSVFRKGLEAAAEKINEYYEKSATSHAYTFVMLLNPDSKMTYFDDHWGATLSKEVRKNAEDLFKERFLKLASETTQQPVRKKKVPRHRAMMALLDDDDESESPAAVSQSASPSPAPTQESATPWLQEFNKYLDTEEELPPDVTAVTWWGQNAHRYPVWASLARDFLPIMGSSVSSERAFSGAGITISKRRNRLKGDIVEALQFMRSMYQKDLIKPKPMPTSIMELQLEQGGEVVETVETDGLEEIETGYGSILTDTDAEDSPAEEEYPSSSEEN